MNSYQAVIVHASNLCTYVWMLRYFIENMVVEHETRARASTIMVCNVSLSTDFPTQAKRTLTTKFWQRLAYFHVLVKKRFPT